MASKILIDRTCMSGIHSHSFQGFNLLPSAVAADPDSRQLTQKVNGSEQRAAAAGSDVTLEVVLCIPFTGKKICPRPQYPGKYGNSGIPYPCA